MTSVAGNRAGSRSQHHVGQRKRVRRTAILLFALAATFYFSFIALSILRAQ
jgi:hypothetical protein